MKRTALKRRRPLRRRNPERRVREFARAYGCEERVHWVQSQPCVVPGCLKTPSENAHVSPEGDPSGMGRKGDYRQIVPLCRAHHLELHSIGQRMFNDKHQIDVDLLAAVVQCRWREHQGE